MTKEAHPNVTERSEYKCVSCNYTWKDEICVVEHNINNTNVFFCLNCDDWVKEKTAVLDYGWSLFDEDGFLRHDV